MRGRRAVPAAIVLAILDGVVFSACGNHSDTGTDAQQQGSQAAPAQSESPGADPRAAFETSNILSGMSADIQTLRILKKSIGTPRSGVALGYGSPSMSAVAACAVAGSNENQPSPAAEKLFSAGGDSNTLLPGPALALTVSGETIVVSCSTRRGSGVLMGFRSGDSSGAFTESWKRGDRPKTRLIPIPGGRVAGGGEDGVLAVNDAADGRELWRGVFTGPVADLAYAPGVVLAASGAVVSAHDETSGKVLWSTTLATQIISLSAGSGVVAALTRDGAAEALVLADGAPLCKSGGPYDSSVRAIVDSGRMIVALPRGGAREIELKAGTILRSWTWEGQSSFLAADSEYLYAEASGAAGPRILIAPRSASGEPRVIALPAPVFDTPAAAHGSRGGLLVLLRDGSIALATSDVPQNAETSVLDKAAAPPEPAAAAITTALGRFRQRNPAEPASRYIRFDLFVSGMPVDAAVAFTVFKYTAKESKVERFIADPATLGVIVAAYDDEGSELEANIDELGAKAGVDIRVQKGKTYWIAAGRASSAEGAAFRIFAR